MNHVVWNVENQEYHYEEADWEVIYAAAGGFGRWFKDRFRKDEYRVPHLGSTSGYAQMLVFADAYFCPLEQEYYHGE